MDTVHDIGGRQGFGAVRWEKDRAEKPFHEEWQGRAWAICMLMFATWRGKPEIWTLDWFRHVRERIDPIDFLTRDYYDQWLQSLAATLIDNGAIELKELCPNATADFLDQSASSVGASIGVIGETDGTARNGAPRFAEGDKVRTRLSIAANHTRLPGYARGRVGVVADWHGPRPLADASASGVIKPEHLYTLAFESGDLWPESKGGRERIFIDAWESYLEPA